MTQDVKSGAQAVKNATNSAKTTVKDKQAEHAKEDNADASKTKDGR